MKYQLNLKDKYIEMSSEARSTIGPAPLRHHHNTEAVPWGGGAVGVARAAQTRGARRTQAEYNRPDERTRTTDGGTGSGTPDQPVNRERARVRASEQHGADPVAGAARRHPAVLLLHPVPLQGAGHARAPDLRRQLEVPDLHRPGERARRV